MHTTKKYLTALGLKKDQNLIVHSSFNKIRSAFPGISIDEFIRSLQDIITPDGSLIMPAFTYCFKRKTGDYEIFDRLISSSKVGAVSEVFRRMPDVTRTSSPTHSFSVWGKAAETITSENSPESPLGNDSVLDWLAKTPNSYILLAGVDFSSMSFGHYLEIKAPVPWVDFSPWNYLNVEPVGVSISGEQNLKEIPGCAKSFINFERFLNEKRLITPKYVKDIKFYFLSVESILNNGVNYYLSNYQDLLCPLGTCKTCDSRHQQFNL
jgi:aminoglycoside N3'-acetyltransferase